MAYKFLYIDDTEAFKAEGTIQGLSSQELEIQFVNPDGDWDIQIDGLIEAIPSLDGLMIDLRLNEEKNIDGKISKYRGNTLAQELRTLVKEGAIKDLPIILYSADRNMEISFDKTSSDLFDLCVSKESLKDGRFTILNKRMQALAEGYKRLNQLRNASSHSPLLELLGLTEIELSKLDIRLLKLLEGYLMHPPHTYSHHFIKQIIEKPGILIREKLLAARLGVDIQASEDWSTLLQKLSIYQYDGIYHDGWNRWWMFKIQEWWQLTFKDVIWERSSADVRVKKLNDLFGLNLSIASPIEKAKSTSYWTLCKGLQMPLDPQEGLLIANQEKIFPWQDRDYISWEEALTRKNVESWKSISPLEQTKLATIQKLFARDKSR